MPSFSCSSSIRAASQDHVLRLKVTHNLVHGPPSDLVYNVGTRIPKELDVLWLSDIALSLSGSLDAHQTPAIDIARSGLAHHLYMSLKTNADRLGLNNVSRPFVDDADSLSKLNLTPSRPLPQPSRPHAHLASLHLSYVWRSVNGPRDTSGCLVEEAGPFSSALFLPVEALLNRVNEQFLIHHLVGRYPLIFGPWCKRLDLEMQFFPSIASSILEIVARSANRRFLSRCKHLLKTAYSQHKLILGASAAVLSSYANGSAFESQKEEIDGPSTLTDEQIVCESLEQLFRGGTPQRRFKPMATPKFVLFSPQDDDDSLLESTPDGRTDDATSWVELPEATMSPRVPLGDYYQRPPDDVDIFAQENWPADGVWHGHEADTCLFAPPEFVMCEAQSDESLINAPVSLASITTRSPQAHSFTLYHHRHVDCHELDPATSVFRKSDSQIVDLEESESSAPFANLTRSPLWTAHDPCFSGECEPLTQGLWGASECLETTMDRWAKRDEDSESVLFEDETGDGPEVNLDWL